MIIPTGIFRRGLSILSPIGMTYSHPIKRKKAKPQRPVISENFEERTAGWVTGVPVPTLIVPRTPRIKSETISA